MGLKDLKERPLFIWLEHFLRQHLRGLKIVSIKLTQDKELSIDRCFNLFPDLKRKFWELKNALGSKYLMHYLTFKRTIHFMLILDHRTMKLKCPMSIWLVHCCTYLDRALLEERYQPYPAVPKAVTFLFMKSPYICGKYKINSVPEVFWTFKYELTFLKTMVFFKPIPKPLKVFSWRFWSTKTLE